MNSSCNPKTDDRRPTTERSLFDPFRSSVIGHRSSKCSRLITAVVFGLLLTAAGVPASPPAVPIKFATLAPEGSTWMQTLRAMDEELRKASGGRVHLTLYPGGVAGDEIDVLRKIRIGQLHGGAFSGVGLGAVLPAVRVLELPLLFQNPGEVDYVTATMEEKFARAFEEQGFVLLAFAEAGFVHLFSKKAIRHREDLNRVKIWTWQGDPLALAMFRAYQVAPVPLALPEVLPSLQTGLIDAFYAPPPRRDCPAMVQPGLLHLLRGIHQRHRRGPHRQIPVGSDSGAAPGDNEDHRQKVCTAGSGEDPAGEPGGPSGLTPAGDSDGGSPSRGAEPAPPGQSRGLGGASGKTLPSHPPGGGAIPLEGIPGAEAVRLLTRVDTLLLRLEQLLIWGTLTGLTLLAFLQVLLRNLFGLGFPGLDILLRHSVLWLAITGASLATRTGRHIRIDLLPRLFTPRQRKILDRCIPFLSGVISLLFCFAAVDLVREEQAAGSIAFGTVPTWLLQLILPVGFAIFAFRFTLQGFLGGGELTVGSNHGEERWTG